MRNHTHTVTRISRISRTVLLAFIVAAAALLAQAPRAGALTATAEAGVEYGNANCGDTVLGAPVIGTARFVRSGNQMVVRYVTTAADAATGYDVVLFDGDTCAPITRLGAFVTDAAGAGSLTSKKVPVAGVTRFYAVARDTTTFVGLTHGSLAVDLP